MVEGVNTILSLMTRLGGVARWGTLRRHLSRSEIDRAVASKQLQRVARGRFALLGVPDSLVAAIRVTGVVSHRSAAALYGWELKAPPPLPEVTVPRDRRVPASTRRLTRTFFVDLTPDEVDGHVTTRRRTLLDCLRRLPFDEALTIADSALRRGDVSPAGLVQIAAEAYGPGARMARRVAALADGRAANPFESVLRAICLELGLSVQAQVSLCDGETFLGRPDLVCAELRLVLEADSYAHHASRGSLVKDCHRYNDFVAAGWRVLRFTWEDVIQRPERVRETLLRFLAVSRPRRPGARPRTLAA